MEIGGQGGMKGGRYGREKIVLFVLLPPKTQSTSYSYVCLHSFPHSFPPFLPSSLPL